MRWPTKRGQIEIEDWRVGVGADKLRTESIQLLRTLPQRSLNGLFSKRRHDTETYLVGMEAIIGQIALEQALAVYHGAEIIEIGQVILVAVIL